MDETAQFVSDLNVARFVDGLQLEDEPTRRALLQKLLIEEEDKLGRNAERLSKLQRHITEGNHRIAMQKALIERLRANGHDIRLAERTLNNLSEIQRILEHHRQCVLNAMDRSR
jgi:hypothetical protein